MWLQRYLFCIVRIASGNRRQNSFIFFFAQHLLFAMFNVRTNSLCLTVTERFAESKEKATHSTNLNDTKIEREREGKSINWISQWKLLIIPIAFLHLCAGLRTLSRFSVWQIIFDISIAIPVGFYVWRRERERKKEVNL